MSVDALPASASADPGLHSHLMLKAWLKNFNVVFHCTIWGSDELTSKSSCYEMSSCHKLIQNTIVEEAQQDQRQYASDSIPNMCKTKHQCYQNHERY